MRIRVAASAVRADAAARVGGRGCGHEKRWGRYSSADQTRHKTCASMLPDFQLHLLSVSSPQKDRELRAT